MIPNAKFWSYIAVVKLDYISKKITQVKLNYQEVLQCLGGLCNYGCVMANNVTNICRVISLQLAETSACCCSALYV